ncbi:hypothetical protein [Staphylococcus parequorum]|uniref:hypothetical protein n=1 Tax=Staphylococcus sp. S9 TaxID=3135640 RepID=UPI003CFF3DD7
MGFYTIVYLCPNGDTSFKKNIINFKAGVAVKGGENQSNYVVAKEDIRSVTRVIAKKSLYQNLVTLKKALGSLCIFRK